MMLRKKAILSEAKIWQHILVEWVKPPMSSVWFSLPQFSQKLKIINLMISVRGL